VLHAGECAMRVVCVCACVHVCFADVFLVLFRAHEASARDSGHGGAP
jgi:hypothetical protein